jgi:hypothetical protein
LLAVVLAYRMARRATTPRDRFLHVVRILAAYAVVMMAAMSLVFVTEPGITLFGAVYIGVLIGAGHAVILSAPMMFVLLVLH